MTHFAIATAGVWDFEAGADEWQFCNSYAHVDQTQAGGCPGASGLWFGTDGWASCGGVGYGNNWNDIAWITVGLLTDANPRLGMTHRFELEEAYDYAFVEVRPWKDATAGWTTLAAFDGQSGCRTDSWAIPAAVLTAGDLDGNGVAAVEVRLRMSSDGGWSSEDGAFCGIGWWVDEVTLSGLYPAAVGLPAAADVALLQEPAPNPFNPATILRYHVPAGTRAASLTIYDQRGRQVRALSADNGAGWHEVRWDGRTDAGARVASGLYFARFVADDVARTRKMVLVQ